MSQLKTDICIIGAGSAGLSLAAAAVQLERKVILIETGKMGGDCLNYGCVPSKALINYADKFYNYIKFSKNLNNNHAATADFSQVRKYIEEAISAIEYNDSVERFTKLGVHVIQEKASFQSQTEVKAGNNIIKANKFIIATGSSPFIPTIDGINDIDYLTNENIFQLKALPQSMAIIGGGPIGMELAQAFNRLGCKIHAFEAFTPLAKDDPKLTKIVLQTLEKEGVTINDNTTINSLSKNGDNINIKYKRKTEEKNIEVERILIATGRKPVLNDLGLEKAKVNYTKSGIVTNKFFRTSNKNIYAIGDVIGGMQFTHAAGYHAGLLIKKIIFHLPINRYNSQIPWVTYTNPELATYGLSEKQAKQKYYDVEILKLDFSENDRSQIEKATNGMIKIIIRKSGKILGATIVGKNAGELLQPWILAISKGLNIKDIANIIAPYPTVSEINKRVATGFYIKKLDSSFTKSLLKILKLFG